MDEFNQLWEHWNFRQWFIDAGLFARPEDLDKAVSRELWDGRNPYFSWKICPGEGCEELVPAKEEGCQLHSGRLPRWKLVAGELWKRLVVRTGHAGNDCCTSYVLLAVHLAEKMIGRAIPRGFVVITRNGNPLDLRPENIIIISEISSTLVKEGQIRLEEAEEFDSLIVEFLRQRQRGGRPPFLGRYSFGDIAKLSETTAANVRSDASRRLFNPASLRDTLEYIQKRTRHREITKDKITTINIR